jgi:hypothetical protein
MRHPLNRMRRRLLYAALLLCIGMSSVASALEMSPRKVLSTNGSDRATRLVQSNKIATLDGISHVSWLDFDNKVQIASYDSAIDQWSGTTTIGVGQDNHGPASIAMDSEGYLHAIFGPHNSSFQYKVSAQPNDSSSWVTKGNFGTFATYPSLVIDENDTLHFTYRGGGSSLFPLSLFYRQLPKGGTWSTPKMLANTGPGYADYAHYHQSMAIGPSGEIHLAYNIYKFDNPSPYDRATGAGHMMSLDGGTSWQTIEGEQLSSPVQPHSGVFYRTSTAPYGLSSHNVALDSQGDPWISVWDYDNLSYSTSYLYHHDGTDWKSYRVNDLLPAAYSGMRFSSDFSVGLDDNDNIYVAGSMNGNVAVLYGSNPDEGPFDLLIVDPARAGFTPQGINIERNVGHNDLGTPRISYYSGTDGTPSTVYTVQLINDDDAQSRSWRLAGSGIWTYSSSWSPSSAPNSEVDRAIFGPSITAPSTVMVDANVTTNSLTFNSSHAYALAGTGTINFDGGDAGILVSQGQHQIQTKVALQADVSIDAVSGSVEFLNQIDLAGNTLTILGNVEIQHSVVDTIGGGAIINAGMLTTLGGASLAGDLTSVGTLAFDALSATSVASALSIAGQAVLRGEIEVSFVDATTPIGDVAILTASNGITLTGPLTLTGSGASMFRGVRVVGNRLVLSTYSVPEPAGVLLGLVGMGISSLSFARPRRQIAASVLVFGRSGKIRTDFHVAEGKATSWISCQISEDNIRG